MSNNPYARFVDGDPAAMLREYPGLLQQAIGKLGPLGMGRRLAPGKWTVAEILCHLADTEIAFSFRWRQTLAEQDHTVQTFDQDHWARLYGAMPGERALDTLLALRSWNIILLDRLSAADWERKAFHPELGELQFRTLVEVMAGHDRNHLAQFIQIAALPA